MSFLLLLTLVAFSQQQSTQSIEQKSTGPCSSNNAGVQGTVTVIISCPGVGPEAMNILTSKWLPASVGSRS